MLEDHTKTQRDESNVMMATLAFARAPKERPSKFSAVAIEEVIDLLVDTSLEEAQDMEPNRQRTLLYWQAMMKKDNTQ